MPNEETTTKLKVDITELKKEMQEASRYAKLADSEFKKVASTCDDWTKSSDAISAKITSLNGTLDSQKKKLSLLEAQYAEVVAEQGKGSKAAQELEIKMNKQQATVNKTQREIDNLGGTLEEVTKAEKIATKTGKDVSDVLDDMRKSSENAEGGFSILKGSIATFAGNAMTALAGAAKDGIMKIAGLADETREYRTEMGKLDTAYTTNGHSAEAAQKTYEELQAVLGDEGQAVEAANFMAKLAKSEEDLANWTNIATGVYGTFGASLPIEGLAEAANETAKVGQVTGPLADALNWTTLSAEQWNTALSSNPKAMAAFNKGIKEGMSQEDAFNEALSKCSTEQQRQELIMNSLNTMYGDAANAYRETNGEIMEANRAQSALTDAQARLGEIAEPVVTTVKQGFADLLSTLLDLVGNVNMEEFTAKIKDGFSILTDTVIPAVKDGFQWVIDHGDIIMAVLKGIAAGMAAYTIYSTALNVMKNGWMALTVVQKAATAAQWLMNAAMNANPMMLIVSVITAVIVAIVTFIAKNDDARKKFTEIWQSVKDFFIEVWDGIIGFFTKTIPNAFKKVINWVKDNFDLLLTFLINPFAGLFKYFYENNKKFKEFVDNAIKYIKELPGKVWTWLKNTIDKVKTWASDMGTKAKDAAKKFLDNTVNTIKELPGKIWTWLKNVVTKIVSWGSDLASKGKDAALKLFNAVVDKIKEIPDKVVDIGKDLVRGIMEGITNSLTWIKDRLKEWVGNVTKFVKKIFKIGSPSKLWRDQIGVWLARGIAVGIEKGKVYAQKVLATMSKELLTSEQKYLDESARIAKEKEEQAYQEKLAAAKNAEELEKVKQERIKELAEKEQESYLEGLKAIAEKEKEIFDNAVKQVEDFVAKAVEKSEALKEVQKSIADTFKGEGSLTYRTESFTFNTGDGSETFSITKLADVGADNAKLREFNNMLDELAGKRGLLPTEISNYLSEMGLEEGKKYVSALLEATDDEYNNYISALEEKSSLAQEISEKVTNTMMINLGDEIFKGLEELPQGFTALGIDSATEFGAGLMSKLGEVLSNTKSFLDEKLSSWLDDNAGGIRDDVKGAKFKISATNSSLRGGGSNTVGPMPVVKNFTQNIYSPTAPNRLTIYRNTKNLLGLA